MPLQTWTGPYRSRKYRLAEFVDNRHMKVARLSALHTGPLYPPRKIPGTHFCCRSRRPQGHSTAGRIRSMQNCSDPNGNRTRDHPACTAVPQQNALPCTLTWITWQKNTINSVGISVSTLQITAWNASALRTSPPCFLSLKRFIYRRWWWNDTNMGQPRCPEKNPSHCPFAQHISHTEWTEIEPGPPRTYMA